MIITQIDTISHDDGDEFDVTADRNQRAKMNFNWLMANQIQHHNAMCIFDEICWTLSTQGHISKLKLVEDCYCKFSHILTIMTKCVVFKGRSLPARRARFVQLEATSNS